MRLFRSLLMIVGLLALVAGGAAAATPDRVEPPCHSQMSGSPSDSERPAAPMKVMNCCVAWVIAPPTPATPPAATLHTPRLPTPSLARQMPGLSPAPEIAPPRA